MLSFYWPISIILLPLPWLLNRLLQKKKATINNTAIYFPRIEKLQEVMNDKECNPQKPTLINILWYIVWCLLIITLMRPEIVQEPKATEQYGYDLMLAVDLSRSMSALDFTKGNATITRLHAVKEVVNKFIKQRKGDRVGLIAFAAAAYPYVPLTFDLDSVSQQLQQLTVGMAGDSTAIGDAIGLAIKSLSKRKGQRILILLTDGEDNSSRIPPLQAAKLAAKHKIKIYTIGVGSDGRVPIRDNDGNLVVIESRIDEKLLTSIAETTGATYARATSKMTLAEIYQQIDKLEQHAREGKVVVLRTTLHYFPLGGALIILLGLLFNYRRYVYALL